MIINCLEGRFCETGDTDLYSGNQGKDQEASLKRHWNEWSGEVEGRPGIEEIKIGTISGKLVCLNMFNSTGWWKRIKLGYLLAVWSVLQ